MTALDCYPKNTLLHCLIRVAGKQESRSSRFPMSPCCAVYRLMGRIYCQGWPNTPYGEYLARVHDSRRDLSISLPIVTVLCPLIIIELCGGKVLCFTNSDVVEIRIPVRLSLKLIRSWNQCVIFKGVTWKEGCPGSSASPNSHRWSVQLISTCRILHHFVLHTEENRSNF